MISLKFKKLTAFALNGDDDEDYSQTEHDEANESLEAEEADQDFINV